MKKKQIEDAIRKSLMKVPTIPFEEIEKQPYIKVTESDFITNKENIRPIINNRALALAMVCFLFILLPLSGWWMKNRLPNSTITIDINPSIEIVTNRKDEVISLKALNKDGKELVKNLKYKNHYLDDIVDTILDLSKNQGYLKQDGNAILISVKNRNVDDGMLLLTKINDVVSNSTYFKDNKSSVLQQVLPVVNKSAKKIAKYYHISEGKAVFVQWMVSKNSELSVDNIATLSIAELVKLADKKGIRLDDFILLNDEKTIKTELNKQPLSENAEPGKANNQDRDQNINSEYDADYNNRDRDRNDQSDSDNQSGQGEIKDQSDLGKEKGQDKNNYQDSQGKKGDQNKQGENDDQDEQDEEGDQDEQDEDGDQDEQDEDDDLDEQDEEGDLDEQDEEGDLDQQDEEGDLDEQVENGDLDKQVEDGNLDEKAKEGDLDEKVKDGDLDDQSDHENKETQGDQEDYTDLEVQDEIDFDEE